MSADAISTERGAFGSFARPAFNVREEVKLVADSETDAGSDAVALAIRDLTEEVRQFRTAYLRVEFALLQIKRNDMSIEDFGNTVSVFADLRKS